ncbi:hypothetical protein DYI37_03875 [Fulvimarina endophytica]|uniref:Uncharacterized protein n=1 Tax=Fulvimarina endophytica TaxID=2293836 RepID=A0A371X7H2_9HYPH|nr:hypothetical protein [Fulvimarina endophytica]RFC65014.1 hypothetical protein DYI37_03875 [Fulvimarina endophytica]
MTDTTKVKMTDATVAQLMMLATQTLGLEIEGTPTKAQLKAKIAEAGFSETEFEVEEEVEPVENPTDAQIAEMDDERTVRIVIPKQEGVPGGTDAVPIGVNGRVARVMRGIEVDVPVKYVRVLDNAKKTVFTKDENQKIIGKEEVHIYPFSVIRAY